MFVFRFVVVFSSVCIFLCFSICLSVFVCPLRHKHTNTAKTGGSVIAVRVPVSVHLFLSVCLLSFFLSFCLSFHACLYGFSVSLLIFFCLIMYSSCPSVCLCLHVLFSTINRTEENKEVVLSRLYASVLACLALSSIKHRYRLEGRGAAWPGIV